MTNQADSTPIIDTALSQILGYRLKRAYMKLQPGANDVMAELGLRLLSFSCLCLIVDNESISQSALGEALRVERSNLVVPLDDLEVRGLIRREKVEGDRRRYALVATPEGQALRDKAVQMVMEREAFILSNFSAEDRMTLSRIMNRLDEIA